MTLAELRDRIEVVNMQGMSPLNNEKLVVFQAMAFDWMLKLCEPLNLLVPYRDNNIYRFVEEGWYLKEPTLAREDDDIIDIDERLEMAFVYIIVSMLAIKSGGEKRFEASRLVLEYSINVNEMGYSKAKQVYEKESFLTAVKFDCYGKFYEVSEDFVKLVIDCILCNGVCMRADEIVQLDLYKQYLNGTVLPLNKERLIAVDSAVFNYFMQNMDEMMKYSDEQLSSVTTRFEELCKLGEGEEVAKEVKQLDQRLGNEACCEEKHELKGCVDEYHA